MDFREYRNDAYSDKSDCVSIPDTLNAVQNLLKGT